MKKIFKSMVVVGLCFLLTGCVKVDMDVRIDTDKTADIVATIKISETLLSTSGEEIDLNSDEFKELKDAGAELSVEEIENEKWLVIKSKSKDVTLEKSLEIKDGMMYLDVNKFGEEKSVSDTTSKVLGDELFEEDNENHSNNLSSDNSSSNFSPSDMSMMQNYMNMFDIQYKFTMPNKPEAKVGKIEGNTVILNTEDLMKISEDAELGIIFCRASKPFFTEPWFLSICGICAGGAVALLVVAKVKPKSEEKEDTKIEE